MEFKFIPDTNNLYSINENGVVFSYVLNRELVKTVIKQTAFVSIRYAYYYKPKVISVNKLMKNVFNIQPPDNYHGYDIICDDGDALNNSRINLKFVIRLNREYKYYTQPFYDCYGIITHKICGVCGDKKDIKYFPLDIAPNRKKTYRAICCHCKSIERKNQLANDPVKRAINDKSLKAYRSSERNKNNKRRIDTYHRKYLNDTYIKKLLLRPDDDLCINDITLDLVELKRQSVKINRLYKELKNEHTKE